jgi:hypothetical protein
MPLFLPRPKCDPHTVPECRHNVLHGVTFPSVWLYLSLNKNTDAWGQASPHFLRYVSATTVVYVYARAPQYGRYDVSIRYGWAPMEAR